jgi:hypothetical protein
VTSFTPVRDGLRPQTSFTPRGVKLSGAIAT